MAREVGCQRRCESPKLQARSVNANSFREIARGHRPRLQNDIRYFIQLCVRTWSAYDTSQCVDKQVCYSAHRKPSSYSRYSLLRLAAWQYVRGPRSRPMAALRQSAFAWRSLRAAFTKRKPFETSSVSNIAMRTMRSRAFGSI